MSALTADELHRDQSLQDTLERERVSMAERHHGLICALQIAVTLDEIEADIAAAFYPNRSKLHSDFSNDNRRTAANERSRG